MKKELVISNISSFKGWESCFRYFMEKSDNFTIIFQGEKDDTTAEGLNRGKKEFLDLPLITISPYAGMKDSFEVAGELTKAAQDIFLNFMTSSFDGYTSDLWSFQLLKGNVVNLRIADFDEAFFSLDESELEYLSSKDIDTKNLEEVDLSLAAGEECVVVPMSDLEDLATALKKAFLDPTP
ncbi:hypothetical protein KSC_032940 [Ktedonobacter sp. SOSP1-52]|uniref:hypothetical protein n=1 Tax=Ktedonobacter sp. SOSP1-52 TaxID=2778366 RepID=UPI0019167703|nr:hypothetical protein [Ktedonobacter sp. SOSP1-52]GHO64402.1 hypothetical protein KSC_032940 [Ktedonobacter sp. SOSP1-52]